MQIIQYKIVARGPIYIRDYTQFTSKNPLSIYYNPIWCEIIEY